MWVLIIGALLSSAAFLALAIYGPQLQQRLISSLNQYLKTKVQTQNINLSLWQDFPNLTLNMTNVRVQPSALDTPRYLARFHKVKAVVDPLSVITSGPYEIAAFKLSDGYLKPRVSKALKVNYQILKNPDTAKSTNKSTGPALNVRNVVLRNIRLDYRNHSQGEVYELFSRRLALSGKVRQASTRLSAKGKGLLNALKINGNTYAAEKPFKIKTTLKVQHDPNQYQVKQGKITLAGADFSVKGKATNKQEHLALDLTIAGKDNNLQTLLSLTPEYYRKKFSSYSGKGQFYFKAKLNGPVSPTQNPRFKVDFGIKNGTIMRGNQSKPLKAVQLEGHFTNGKQAAALTSMLELKNFEASLNDRNLYGSLTLTNFTDPYLNLHLRGRPRLQNLQALIPNWSKPAVKGDFFIDADFAGRIRHLKQVATIPKFNFKGRMGLEKAGLSTPPNHPDISKLNGYFNFNGNDLEIQRLRGKAGKSFFNLTGRVRNVASFMLLPGKKLKVEADLHSRRLFVAPLLMTANEKGRSSDSAATFALPDFLALDLGFTCEELNYHRFQATGVDGQVAYQDETLELRQLNFQSMKGNVELAGNLKSMPNGNLRVRLKGTGKDIKLDELFYQMENFGQKVLTKDHLEGQVTTNVKLEAAWDPHLQPLYDKLELKGDVVVENGKIKRFQPMMKLAGLVDVDELRQVNFQKLENQVIIKNRKIRIPRMAIKSNAFEGHFSGVHHFDNTIEYHIQFNLSEILFGKKEEYETAFGKVVRSENGNQLNLFVKMTGSASDPNLQFDKKAVAQKINKDLEQEGEELRKALTNPGESGDDQKDNYQLKWDK